MEVEIRAEKELEEADVEEVAVDGVVLRDGITEHDAIVVHGPVDTLLVKEVGEVVVKEFHQRLRVGARSGRFHRTYSRGASST